MKFIMPMSALAGSLAIVAGIASAHHTPAAQAVPPSALHAPAGVRTPSCATATPRSAAGFTALWASLDQAQWGAADVSISVPLADGRSVWLYGDTFSTGRFVHSTAITQDHGCLHVSRGGDQLLPNWDANHIYWIESATARGSQVSVRARGMTLTGTCAWCFKDGGYSAIWSFTVNAAGDLVDRTSINSHMHVAALDPGPLLACPGAVASAHHFCYARHTHPEFRLAFGRTLVTTDQNWDDGTLHPVKDYRPIFTDA